MKSIAAVLCAALAAPAGAEAVKHDSAGLKSVEIRVEAGKVEVADGAELSVEALNVDAERCRITQESKDGVLRVRAKGRAGKSLFGKGCRAGFRVSAPPRLLLKIEAGAGDVEVSGMAGGTVVDLGAGNIAFKNVSGKVEANNGAGNIEATLKAAPAELRTGAGNIEAAWTEAPPAGTIEAESGVGTVELSLPGTAKLRSKLNAGLGSASSEFEDDEKAPLAVSANAGVGSVSLTKTKG